MPLKDVAGLTVKTTVSSEVTEGVRKGHELGYLKVPTDGKVGKSAGDSQESQLLS